MDEAEEKRRKRLRRWEQDQRRRFLGYSRENGPRMALFFMAVGPSLGHRILQKLSFQDLMKAIENGDRLLLLNIKGVGRKTIYNIHDVFEDEEASMAFYLGERGEYDTH